MKFTLSLAALITLASAAVINKIDKRDSPFQLKITKVGNTLVKATITNTGSEDLDLYSLGNFLDSAPVEKLKVSAATSSAAFTGLRIRYATDNLDDSAFTTIAAGQTIDVDVDIASLHDLAEGGAVDVVASGTLLYAAKGARTLEHAVAFDSNKLSFEVDGAKAAMVPRALDVFSPLEKRSIVNSDCTGTRRTASINALANCRSIALAAATAASSGSATKFSEYFKTTSTTTRSQVATILNRVASECGSTTTGATTTHCADAYGACGSNVLAYTYPSLNYINNCPLYFSALPALTRSCHAQDQATTTLHETTHANAIAGTDDVAYGYTASTRLTTSQAVNNADTYALYANAIYAAC